MTIRIELETPADVVRLVEALRDSGSLDDVTDRRTRRSLDEVGLANGYRRGEVLAQAVRAWAWLTPRTREAMLSAWILEGPDAATMRREIDEAAARYDEVRRARFSAAATGESER